MWGSKKRTIDALTGSIVALKKEIRDLYRSVADKNKKIIALDEALNEGTLRNGEQAQILKNQSELVKGLNAQISQLTRALEREQAETRKAADAADAAIKAGGILGDQLHAAQAVIAVKDDIADVFAVKIEELKADNAKLYEALGQARAELGQLRDGVVNAVESGRLQQPAPTRPKPARPQREIVPAVPDRSEPDGRSGKSS
jgi:chromosome segregation ATPase